jgi:CBS domain containing-hemolysin-like protein
MLSFILGIIFLILTLVIIELEKSYHKLPLSELRYRARHGDKLAEHIYHASSFGSSLDLLIWFLMVVFASLSLFLFDQVAPLWLDFITLAIFIFVAFIYWPKKNFSKLSHFITTYFSPPLIWILDLIHPLGTKLNLKLSQNELNQIYSLNDLEGLLVKLKKNPEVRIQTGDLDLLLNQLKLISSPISKLALPWSKIKTVNIEERLGPIVLDELHHANQAVIPVIKEDEDKICGVLDLHNLNLGQSDLVQDHLQKELFYIKENDTASSALGAFLITNSTYLIVVDDQGNYSGLLVLSDIIKLLAGNQKTKPLTDYISPPLSRSAVALDVDNTNQ